MGVGGVGGPVFGQAPLPYIRMKPPAVTHCHTSKVCSSAIGTRGRAEVVPSQGMVARLRVEKS